MSSNEFEEETKHDVFRSPKLHINSKLLNIHGIINKDKKMVNNIIKSHDSHTLSLS